MRMDMDDLKTAMEDLKTTRETLKRKIKDVYLLKEGQKSIKNNLTEVVNRVENVTTYKADFRGCLQKKKFPSSIM